MADSMIDRVVSLMVLAILAAALIPVAISQLLNTTFSNPTIANIWGVLPIVLVIVVLVMFVNMIRRAD